MPQDKQDTPEGPSGERPAQAAAGDSETTDEAPVGESVNPKWRHVTRFPIADRMKDIVEKTIEAAKLERAACLRKLRKMQYGS